MLAVLQAGKAGESDLVLQQVAQALMAQGLRVLGAVQQNTDRPDGRPCDMDLHLIPDGQQFRISQSLGLGSSGCRLDPEGVETAAGYLARQLSPAHYLLVLNKFGKQEAHGGGFRPLIGEALALGIPVLTAVKPQNAAAFEAFTEGMAEALPNDVAAVLAWVKAQTP